MKGTIQVDELICVIKGNYSGPYGRIVMPAKAGIQVLNKLLKIRLKAWTPAFAGMTT